MEENQKIKIASLFLGDKANNWFQGWQVTKPKASWYEFLETLCKRFGELNVSDVVKEFNKLLQEGFVLEYQEKFEELKSLMVKYNPGLSEIYFISSFISGLNEEVRQVVTMFRPDSLLQVFE